ncbi:bifunctional N(6)-L-threonylcarbamoyladenine synthase/serine/threonine protein kinase [Nanoarchaeota archaeon]
MICLGIESTAHTFGVGIIKDKKVLANIKKTYTTEKGGIIPIDAAKHHHEIKDELLEKALDEAKIKLEDVDLIAFSQSPGLSPCLLEGMRTAKELSKKLKVPLVGVNHCIAHLEIGRLLTKAKDPVLLYSSGANTQIIGFAEGRYRIFGETVDIGLGNFIDSFARCAGLGFPGGPKMEKLALKSKKLIELPYSIKGMDVSFSGLLTNLQQKLNKEKLEDLAYSMQETAFPMLIEAAERAMAHLHKKELLFGGGVACNKRYQEMGEIMCKERDAKFYCPENQFLVDNAAMIAWLGILMEKHAVSWKHLDKIDIDPYERTDDVEITWR